MNRPVGAAALGVAAAGAWTGMHLRAPAVRGWTRASRVPIDSGPLFAEASQRTDDGEVVVVLLHGIVGSGLSFGEAYDDLPATVVVPDLLGFGRSMWLDTPDYTVETHVRSVCDTLENAGFARRPVVVVGHSMGGVLALHVAAQLDGVRGVVTFDAPLYDGREEGLDHVGAADPLASLVATGDIAERICSWMCNHRGLARRLWPIFAPRWPIPVAADGVLHTWPAYIGSLEALVLDSGYRTALATLDRRDVPVVLVNGAADGVPVQGRAQQLAGAHANVDAIEVPDASHGLPLSHPDRCRTIIERLLQA